MSFGNSKDLIFELSIDPTNVTELLDHQRNYLLAKAYLKGTKVDDETPFSSEADLTLNLYLEDDIILEENQLQPNISLLSNYLRVNITDEM